MFGCFKVKITKPSYSFGKCAQIHYNKTRKKGIFMGMGSIPRRASGLNGLIHSSLTHHTI